MSITKKDISYRISDEYVANAFKFLTTGCLDVDDGPDEESLLGRLVESRMKTMSFEEMNQTLSSCLFHKYASLNMSELKQLASYLNGLLEESTE